MRRWVWTGMGALAALVLSTVTCFADQPSYTMQAYGLGTYDRNNPSASTVVPKTPVLAFEGLTLQRILNENFTFYAHFCGSSVGGAFRKPVGGYRIQSFPGNDTTDPFVIATFTLLEDPWTKGVTVKFTDGEGGVWAQAINASHRRNLDLNYAFVKSLNQETGEITYQANDGSTSDSIATGYTSGGNYGICGLRASKFLHLDAPILVFANGANGAVLTLDDIKDYDFSAYFAGSAASQAIRPAVVKGYNKAFTVEGNGSVTALRVEFQLLDDHYVKCVVVQFTNGAAGVYGQVLVARYIDVNNVAGGGLGYAFVKADGSYNGNNSAVATQHANNGYGVYDLFAEPPAPTVTLELDRSKTWSELVEGVDLGSADVEIKLLVTGENPTLTFDTAVSRQSVTVTNESTAATAIFAMGNGTLTLDQLTIPASFTLTVPPDAGVANVEVGANGVIRYPAPESGATLAMAISGAGGVEVASGVLTFGGYNTYSGGTRVKSGATAKAGGRCGTVNNLQVGPFGIAKATTNPIIVEEGGAYDYNGNGDNYYYITICGKDGIINSGEGMGTNKAQTYGINLSGNAELTMNGLFGIVTSGYNQSGALGLGEYTLVKSGTNPFFIWTSGTTVSGSGTLEVAEGTFQVSKGGVTGVSATLKIDEEGTVEALHNLAFYTIENNGTIMFNPGSATNTINGIYTGTGVVHKLGANMGLMTFHNGAKSVYYVDGGTLGISQRTSVQGNPYAFNTPENPNANMSVVVADGATFDVNGVADTSCSVTIAGKGVGDKGAFVNSKSDVGSGSLQTVQLTLTADALVGGAYNFGVLAPGYRPTLLELGDHTLTINKEKYFWLVNATVTGSGTINVTGGTLSVQKGFAGTDYSLTVGENGKMEMVSGVTAMAMRDLKNDGTITGGTITASGTVTAGKGAIPNLTLADGATIKITSLEEPLVVSGTYTASGTVTVDAAGIPASPVPKPVVSVPAGTSVSGVTYKLINAEPSVTLAVRDGIPYLAKGGMLILLK